jgi:RNA polymerase sigma factor (sigma-70 family)
LAARLASLSERVPGVEEIADLRLDVRAVVDVILMLPERDREVLLLAAWERLSTAEIASVLGCSENAAALRLHRARRRLVELHRKGMGSIDQHGEWLQLRRRQKGGPG